MSQHNHWIKLHIIAVIIAIFYMVYDAYKGQYLFCVLWAIGGALNYDAVLKWLDLQDTEE